MVGWLQATTGAARERQRVLGAAEKRSLASLFIRRQLFLHRKDVADFVLAIEMQFEEPNVELAHHGFDTPLD